MPGRRRARQQLLLALLLLADAALLALTPALLAGGTLATAVPVAIAAVLVAAVLVAAALRRPGSGRPVLVAPGSGRPGSGRPGSVAPADRSLARPPRFWSRPRSPPLRPRSLPRSRLPRSPRLARPVVAAVALLRAARGRSAPLPDGLVRVVVVIVVVGRVGVSGRSPVTPASGSRASGARRCPPPLPSPPMLDDGIDQARLAQALRALDAEARGDLLQLGDELPLEGWFGPWSPWG